MASFNGSNYALIAANPSAKIPAGELSGKKRILYDSYTGAQAVYAISDKINMGALLPKGARVLDAKIACASLGTTGKMQLGIAAGTLEAADPNAFIEESDAGGQGVLTSMPLGSYGLAYKFPEAAQVQINFTEATDVATGVVIHMWIEYILD